MKYNFVKLQGLFVLLTSLLSLAEGHLMAQATDNTGKELFVVKNTSNFSFPISSNSVSVNYTSPFDSHLRSYYFINTMKDSIAAVAARTPSALTMVNTHLPGVAALAPGTPMAAILTTINGFSDTSFENLMVQLDGLNLTTGFYNVTDVGRGSSPLFVNFKASNLSFSSPGDFFTTNNQPTLQLEYGGIFNSVIKFDNWDQLSQVHRPGKLGFLLPHDFDLYWSVFANTSCITYFDTVSHKRTPTDWSSVLKFGQYGVKVDANLYYSKSVAIALTGTFYRGLPLDKDKGYQSSRSLPVTAVDSTIFIAGKAIGKYGGSIGDQKWNARISVALPIFLNFFSRPNPTKAGTGSVYILPSYVPSGSLNTHWTNQLGVSFNLLSKPYGGVGSSIVQAGGIGVDVLSDLKKKTGWGSPVYYVTGTININSIIPQRGRHIESH